MKNNGGIYQIPVSVKGIIELEFKVDSDVKNRANCIGKFTDNQM